MEEPVGEMATVDATVKAVGLAGGVGLVLNELPRGWEWAASVDPVLVLEITEHECQVVGARHGLLAGVIELNGLGLEGDQEADPVAATDIDGDEELVEVEDGASRWCYPTRPACDVGVIVGAMNGRFVMELLGEWLTS